MMNKKILAVIAIVVAIGVVAIGYLIYNETPEGTFRVSGVILNIPEGYTVKKEGEGYATLIKDDKQIIIYEVEGVSETVLQYMESSGDLSLAYSSDGPIKALISVTDAGNATYLPGGTEKVDNKEIVFYFQEGIANSEKLKNIIVERNKQ
ncbi:MAG: hypothetical protein FWH29_00370 [Methanobrevibacter sp.]|nr:hypothetical protein [Methanobrevibacter sp.]